MPVLTEDTVRKITNFFYWHHVVQEYYMRVISDEYSGHTTTENSTTKKWATGIKYIYDHGNSIWAKIDYFAGKLRIFLFIAVIILMFALIAGWRP
jgi:hypothetical protein